MLLRILGGLVLALLLMAGSASAAKPVLPGLVKTTEGPVQGTLDASTGVWEFKGIPYAAPPVGDRRFARPGKPARHKDTLLAGSFPSACPQIISQLQTVCGDGVPAGEKAGDEDCLALNVFTPVPAWPPAPTLPVMIFIHGGSFVTGCTAEPLTNGVSLSVNENVVFVSIQYRLGLLGFLATEELSDEDSDGSAGNAAILDMIQAIKWVKRNIKRFGGDPKNITVFGESAGGVGVCALLASPLTEGLFQRAIIESGNCQSAIPLRTTPGSPIDGGTAVQRGESVAESLGCTTPGPDRLACLRGVTPSEILDVQSTISGNFGLTGFSPTIDGHVLEERPILIFEEEGTGGREVIVGSNADEMSIFTLDADLINAVIADYDQAVRDVLGDPLADLLLPFYPGPGGGFNVLVYRRLLGDLIFNCPTLNVANALSRAGDDAYVYHLTHRPFSPIPVV